MIIFQLQFPNGKSSEVGYRASRVEEDHVQRFKITCTFDFVSFAEKATVSAELNRHLELLDEEQLGTVITDCVDFCKNQLSGQFSPLIKVLQVTNYRITGEQMHGGHFYTKTNLRWKGTSK